VNKELSESLELSIQNVLYQTNCVFEYAIISGVDAEDALIIKGLLEIRKIATELLGFDELFPGVIKELCAMAELGRNQESE